MEKIRFGAAELYTFVCILEKCNFAAAYSQYHRSILFSKNLAFIPLFEKTNIYGEVIS